MLSIYLFRCCNNPTLVKYPSAIRLRFQRHAHRSFNQNIKYYSRYSQLGVKENLQPRSTFDRSPSVRTRLAAPTISQGRTLQPVSTEIPFSSRVHTNSSFNDLSKPLSLSQDFPSDSSSDQPVCDANALAATLSPSDLLRYYLDIAAGLSKARLTGLVVSTAVVGCVLAASTSLTSPEFLAAPFRTTLWLTMGTSLTSAAANTVNQILELPYDSQMMRTRNRVLVRGLTTPGRAGLFAFGCASSGLSLLYLGVNPLVAGLAAGNMILYTSVYTPLKRVSQANTWIGALVGAVPPLMGWAAATGELQSGSLILASLLYVWQFPHFMALSWNLRGEYSKAGYAMTAVVDPNLCKRVALRYAVASTLVCLAGAGCSAISLGPWAGCALGLACLPPNLGLIYYAWKFFDAPSGEGSSAAARRLFRVTLVHLPVVKLAALMGTYYCFFAG